ncbi:MAG: hypothetical protein ACMUJM_16510 [bacterium]
MALIRCKECNNEISDKADQCPHCGVKIEKGLTFFKVIGYFFLTIFGLIFIMIALFIIAAVMIPPI